MILLWILIKKNHPQVYLEEYKYRIKKTKVPRFIKTKLKSDSDLDSDDKKLMAKLEKSNSDFDSNSEKNKL